MNYKAIFRFVASMLQYLKWDGSGINITRIKPLQKADGDADLEMRAHLIAHEEEQGTGAPDLTHFLVDSLCLGLPSGWAQ